MRTKNNIVALMDLLQFRTNRALNFDKSNILKEFELDNQQDNFIIKILSIVGGFLSTIAFFGFLMVSGLYDSERGMLISGPIFIGIAILIQRNVHVLIVDTICVCSYLMGFTLLGFGMGRNNLDENVICLVFITLSLTTLFLLRNYILTFVSVLIISGNILVLFYMNEFQDGINVFVSVLALFITFIFLNEGKIIRFNTAFNSLYRPIRIGLIVSFLVALFLLTKNYFHFPSVKSVWISSLVIIVCTIYLLSKISHILNVYQLKFQILIYASGVLIMLPIILYPIISGSILIILLSFYVNYKTGLAIGIITFIYFVGQYYYDLNFTLLTKSILLIVSGLLFLALYFFTHKKLKTDEEI